MNAFAKKMLLLSGVGIATVAAAKALVRRSRWFSYEGRVVIVTGGSRGLGLVLARRLVDAGARVAIVARTPDDVKQATRELLNRGGEVIGIPCDVRHQQEVEDMVQRVVEHWGRIDCLFNVAGIIQVGPLDAMTVDDFHLAMDTNCWGVLHTVLASLPHMRRNGWGRVVNVASLGGKRAVPHLLPYDTSKFALVGLSNGLRTELAKDGIWVTTICPGLMRTGSPRNAIFKGQHRKEYAWFSIGDSLPMFSMDADTAASQILQACQNGDREVIVTNAGNLAVHLQKFAPGWTQEILVWLDRLLPSMGGIGTTPARGHESESSWSPSFLTRLGDIAARQNNEMN